MLFIPIAVLFGSASAATASRLCALNTYIYIVLFSTKPSFIYSRVVVIKTKEIKIEKRNYKKNQGLKGERGARIRLLFYIWRVQCGGVEKEIFMSL